MIVGALLCGINALLMTKFKIPSLVITLATMQIYYGVLLWILEGSIYNLRSNWTWFSFKAIVGNFVPLSVIIAIVLLVVSIFFFKYSKFIKKLYAIGNNKQGARYAGINVEKTMIIVYLISGALLAFTSVILATAGTRVTCTVGNNFEMKVIAAVIVGGTNAMGGSGKIYGTALGALLLAVVSPCTGIYGGKHILDRFVYRDDYRHGSDYQCDEEIQIFKQKEIWKNVFGGQVDERYKEKDS